MGTIIPNLGTILISIMNHLPIADALFTKTQQRVLAILYGKPERSFYLNEIMREAKIGRGSVSRELEKLTRAELITVTALGNQNHYQANPANPIFNELRGIVVKTFGIADVIRESLTGLRKDIALSFIYGSIAKGEETADSDIDVMIVTDLLTYSDVMSRLETAERKLKRVINPTIYGVEEFNSKKKSKSFLKRVLEQPRISLMKTSANPDEAA